LDRVGGSSQAFGDKDQNIIGNTFEFDASVKAQISTLVSSDECDKRLNEARNKYPDSLVIGRYFSVVSSCAVLKIDEDETVSGHNDHNLSVINK